MTNSEKTPLWSKKLFIRMLKIKLNDPSPQYVICNNVKTILEYSLEASQVLEHYNVYYQPNQYFYSELKIDQLHTFDFYKEKFTAYQNYFDKYNEKQILGQTIKLYNWSTNKEKLVFTDYPTDIKMILVVENFNFYDLNSQSILAGLSEDHKNILLIGQIRNDFAFAENHIDKSIKAGKNGGTFCRIE